MRQLCTDELFQHIIKLSYPILMRHYWWGSCVLVGHYSHHYDHFPALNGDLCELRLCGLCPTVTLRHAQTKLMVGVMGLLTFRFLTSFDCDSLILLACWAFATWSCNSEFISKCGEITFQFHSRFPGVLLPT